MLPFYQLETACLETPSFFASDTCVYPCRILSSCMRSLKIATLSLVVKFNDTIIK